MLGTFKQLNRRPMNCAGIAKVLAHPKRRLHARFWNANSLGSSRILRFPTKVIVVTTVAEMQETAHRNEEVESGAEFSVQLRFEQRFLIWPYAGVPDVVC